MSEPADNPTPPELGPPDFAPPDGWRRVRLTLEYDGTDFAGWQVQAKGERTVQGVLEAALAPLGPHGRAVAAGRTDAGVHALGMVAHLDLAHSLSASQLGRALNARLPEDVRVLGAAETRPGFHARFSCRWRAYRYRILNRPVQSPLERRRALWVAGPLDAGAMARAAAHLVGRHDFAAFATQEERQTVRELYACGVAASGEALEFHLVGESFLRHMVRGIAGTLLAVGFGKLEPDEVRAVLESRDRGRAGMNVAPHGLYFEAAGYEPWSP